jgi:hypothetical protein
LAIFYSFFPANSPYVEEMHCLQLKEALRALFTVFQEEKQRQLVVLDSLFFGVKYHIISPPPACLG